MVSPHGPVHPVLLELPLPHWHVALGPLLLALAFAMLAVAALGLRGRAPDLVAVGVVSALLAGLGAARYRRAVALLGPMPIYAYGFLVSASLLAGFLLATRRARQEGLPRNAVSGCFVAAAAGGLVGARLLYVLTNPGDFGKFARVLAVENGGLVFYGGVIGGLLSSYWYTRSRGLPYLAWADAAAPSLALGASIGRIGCYLAGCDYGVPLGAGAPRWLARLGTFPRWPDDVAGPLAGSPAWIDHVLYRSLPLESTASLPVHPTELYDALAGALLFALLLSLGARRHFRGEVFLAFVSGYGMLRFFLELVRDDPERGFYGPAGPARVLIPAFGVVLALAFSVGPAGTVPTRSGRALARLLSFLPALLAFIALRHAPPQRLSTSQWIAVASSVAAALAWRRFARRSGTGGRPPPGTPSALAPTG